MSDAACVPAWDPADGVARVTAAFRDLHGANPDGVWAAPGRVNLIGEHTDYNGGLCLPLALPHRTFVALRRRDDDAVSLASAEPSAEGPWTGRLGDIAPGAVTGWLGYPVGVAWALRQEGYPVHGFDVVVESCVPVGAGLSSSAALECAVAVALDESFDLGLAASDVGRARLAAACVRAENEIAGVPTGGMDQTASLRTKADHALLLDTSDGAVRHVPLGLAAAGLALLVIDTRAPHQLADGQYAERREACEASAARLCVTTLREVADLDAAVAALDTDVARRRVRHVVTEIARVRDVVALLDEGRVAEIGPLLDSSHVSLRDDYEVSCPELDLAVDTARSSGALGARMTGGGFGGSAIALVPTDAIGRVADAVTAAFADAGFAPPGFLIARPSSSAARVDPSSAS